MTGSTATAPLKYDTNGGSFVIILLSLAALLVPSYFMLARSIWTTDEQGHGPIILAVTAWLLWQRRAEFLLLPDTSPNLMGWVFLSIGLLLYVLGRSQQIDTIEIASHIPLLAAALLITKGWQGIRWGAFGLFFLLFMIPLPGSFVQTLTTPLKIAVSHVAETIIYSAGLPVARHGVVLYVGQYQLLVADACSGLNSMFTLEALGLLYLNIMGRTASESHRGLILSALVIPIAFLANVTRVILLIVVTYYMGDEIAQGFLHKAAGITLFLVGLGLIVTVDKILGKLLPAPQAA